MIELSLKNFTTIGHLNESSLRGRKVFVLFTLNFCKVSKAVSVKFELISKRHPEYTFAVVDCAKPENKQALVYFESLNRFPTIWSFDETGRFCSEITQYEIEPIEAFVNASGNINGICNLRIKNN
jgi:hypothetical protein